MGKHYVFRHLHPLARTGGRIRRSRFVLYEKLEGLAGDCFWCGAALNWATLCADHLDSIIENDTPENLVGSCRGCNANRSDGTDYGRRRPKQCLKCFCFFTGGSHHKQQRYCSEKCAQLSRPKRGSTALHGTRSRYVYGCRCKECKTENLRKWREWYRKSNAKYAHK